MVVSGPTDWAFDFRQFWQGGNDVVNGVSPYPSADDVEGGGLEFGPTRIQEVFRFPYPAGAAVALAPFGALSFDFAAAIWGLLLIASILGASGCSACATGACSQSSSPRSPSSRPFGSARSRRCCCSSRRSPGAGATGAGSRAGLSPLRSH